MAISTRSKITWNSGFSSTLNFGYLLDNPVSWSGPRVGSEFVDLQDGSQDAWIVATDYFLSGVVRWIQTSNVADPLGTGWDGATGWRAFIEWAHDSNTFRWFPDKDSGSFINCTLVSPGFGTPPGLNADGSRTVNLLIRSPSSSFDGY